MTNQHSAKPNMKQRRPLPESYWVVPGRFLAGEYPGARDQRLAARKLRRLLQARVTCFLDLTEHGEYYLPPYRALLTEVDSSGTVEYQRWPIPDMGISSQEQMARTLEAIDVALARDHLVYLHCWGGIGRTGMVVACYLIERGLAPAAALEHVSVLRRGTPDSHLPAPATAEQCNFVLTWKPTL